MLWLDAFAYLRCVGWHDFLLPEAQEDNRTEQKLLAAVEDLRFPLTAHQEKHLMELDLSTSNIRVQGVQAGEGAPEAVDMLLICHIVRMSLS